MSEPTYTEILLHRDRLIVSLGLAMICVLSWGWLLSGAGMGMSIAAMSTWQFPPPAPGMALEMPWNGTFWLLMLSMWWIMMIAMMVPSAAPMILLYARVCRRAQSRGRMEAAAIPTSIFALGYVLAWLGFSVAATALHWALEAGGLIHGMTMWSTSAVLSAVFLIAAGLYQLSPLKGVCLEHCRSPADFLSRHWRDGSSGALRMGLSHGLYCIGCCWFLMGLLFVGGVMNFFWIAGLTIFVLAEKLFVYGHWLARLSGVAMIGVGMALLFA